jgi:hypothetical protein
VPDEEVPRFPLASTTQDQIPHGGIPTSRNQDRNTGRQDFNPGAILVDSTRRKSSIRWQRRAAAWEHGFESRRGHHIDSSGLFRLGFVARRGRGRITGPIEDAHRALEPGLHQPRVLRRGLDVGVTQVLLNHA